MQICGHGRRTAVGRPTAVRRPSAVRRPPAEKILPKKNSPKEFLPENFDPETLVIHNQDPLQKKKKTAIAKNICYREKDFLWSRKIFVTAK